ncbi:MAG: FAD-binding protein, partial [Planctomycetales bacterium]|nr:FAD-binding protein [Planctomycetales bacterium]
MGGLWVDYVKNAEQGLKAGDPGNQRTNIPNLYAIGECDYQYHGANRLGANSLLSCIFSGLFLAPCLQTLLNSSAGAAAELDASLFSSAVKDHEARHQTLLSRTGGENPYLVHQELGDVMTRAATVVRRNAQLEEAYGKVCELEERALQCSLADTGSWTNQNVVFTKALIDMFPLAKSIVKGALQRDECRGAHFKPDFAMPSLEATDDAGRLAEANQWCDRFEANTAKWLKSTVVTYTNNEPVINYEDVDTESDPARPRLYGLVGAEVIEKVWRERAAAKREQKAKAAATAS